MVMQIKLLVVGQFVLFFRFSDICMIPNGIDPFASSGRVTGRKDHENGAFAIPTNHPKIAV